MVRGTKEKIIISRIPILIQRNGFQWDSFTRAYRIKLIFNHGKFSKNFFNYVFIKLGVKWERYKIYFTVEIFHKVQASRFLYAILS